MSDGRALRVWIWWFVFFFKHTFANSFKNDIIGGGTIAYILANKGVDVIDCGVPVLSMHAPYEVTSKYDVYSAFKTYKAFWEK